MNGPSEELLDTTEAADFLGVSAATLVAWRCAGDYHLPIVRVGRQVRYKRDDLIAFVDRNRFAHESQARSGAAP